MSVSSGRGEDLKNARRDSFYFKLSSQGTDWKCFRFERFKLDAESWSKRQHADGFMTAVLMSSMKKWNLNGKALQQLL